MNGRCDVILVFVNENEKNAVHQVFQEKFNRKTGVISGDVLTYHDFDIIGGAKVLGIQIQMGSGARGGAAAAISEAIKEKDPKYIILVGIAFAINQKKHRIGDIFISEKLSLYEMRRIGTDEQGNDLEISRGDKASVPEKILGKFKTLSGVPYWHGAPVYLGQLVSGEKLIDNPRFKAKLKKEYPEAIGGEMEAAGAYIIAEFYKKDWIVVKSVCDYADGNKKRNKKKNQQVAAKNAAELVFHVLEKGNFGRFPYQPVKKPGGPIEEKPIPKSPIKKEVRDNITQLLSKRKMESFRRVMQRHLKIESENEKDYQESRWIAFHLTEMGVLDAILTLDLAVKDFNEDIKNTGGNIDLIEFNWHESLGILGWLVLLAVDEDWAEATSQRMAQKGEILDIVFPVFTEVGAETAFSRIKNTGAQFGYNHKQHSIESEKAISCREWDIKDDWNIDDKILTIKMALWKQLFKTDPPPKGKLTDEFITCELRHTLTIRAKKGEYYYMAIDLTCSDYPLLEEEVYKCLVRDLGLDIFFISTKEQRVAIIMEPKLDAQIREFFRNKPDTENRR